MSSPQVQDLLPPPLPPAREVPFRSLLLLFVPAAALAAGTGLQRLAGWGADPLLQWLWWSSAAGAGLGLAAGLALRRKAPWAVYGAASPWLVAALVAGSLRASVPLREGIARRQEAACHAAGRAVCSVAEFTRRCAQAHAEPLRARALLGDPRASSCSAQGCTSRWLYAGPFRPDDGGAPAVACFVVSDAQGRGLRHWLMATEAPAD